MPFDRPGIILKADDLIAIYYGAPMRVQVTEQRFSNNFAFAQYLQPDPRRIAWEISFNNNDAVNHMEAEVSTGPEATMTNLMIYFVAPNGNLVIKRHWRRDLDGVTLPVWVNGVNGNNEITVRQTILTSVPDRA